MTDDSTASLRKLLRGSGLVFVGRIVELGVSFLAAFVVARTLSRAEFGAIQLGATVLSVLSTLTVFGIHTGVGRYLPRFDSIEERRGIFVSAFQMTIPLAVATGALLSLFADSIATNVFNDSAIGPVLRIFGFAVPFAALVRLVEGSLQGQKQAEQQAILKGITIPVTRLVLAVAVLLLGYRTLAVTGAYAAAYVVAGILGIYYLHRYTPLFERVPYKRMHRELIAFSAPLVITILMVKILGNLDTLLLGYFPNTTTDDVGVYNVVYPLSNLVLVVLSSVAFLTIPMISELHSQQAEEEMRRLYQLLTKWVFSATLPVFLVIGLFPAATIRLTFGAKYTGGAMALSILAFGFFFHALMGPNRDALTAVGKTRVIMYDNVFAAALNAALNVVLIPRFGIVGAAVATNVSYIGLNLLYSGQLYRTAGIQPFTRALLKPAVAGVTVMAVLYWVVKTYLPTTFFVLAGMLALFTVLYGISVLRFGGVEREEVELLMEFEEQYDVDLGPLKNLAKRLM